MSKYKVKRSFGIPQILAVVALAFGLVGVGYFALSKNTDKAKLDRTTDAATNCRQNTEIPALRAVVLDRTDPWSDQQKIALKNVAAQITKELVEGQKLLLLPLDGVEAATINPQFEKCAPKNPGDASALTENAKILQQKFKQIFTDPLTVALDKFSVEKTQKESPIIEALQTIAKDHLSAKVSKDRTLYLFSDMMQNSSKYTFFNTANLRADKAEQTAVTDALKGISVKIYQLPRCDVAKLQVQARQFWEAWFVARGAKAEYVTLPGSTESCQNVGAASEKPPSVGATSKVSPVTTATPAKSPPKTVVTPSAGKAPMEPVVVVPSLPTSQPKTAAVQQPPAPAPPVVVAQPPPEPKPAVAVSPSGICSTSVNAFMRNDCMWRRCTREFIGHADCEKYKRESNTSSGG